MLKQIQIGIIAYRKPNSDEFYSPMPLYAPETEELKQQQEFLHTAMDKLVAEGLIDFIKLQKSKKEV